MMTKNIYTLTPPTEYDRLRVQYGALVTYSRVGGRLAAFLTDWDQPSIDLLVRIAYVAWRALDAFIDPLIPSLGADGLRWLGDLRGLWRGLWEDAVLVLANAAARRSFALTQAATTTLGRLEMDLRSEMTLPPNDWLSMGETLLLGIREN